MPPPFVAQPHPPLVVLVHRQHGHAFHGPCPGHALEAAIHGAGHPRPGPQPHPAC
ncbi:MAG TPA: hypothetical protein QGF95_02250 [Candidatus Latescibacteria bacterium]|nr:hypothetical protein [Candidatus Latescibacterota bacterium]